MKRRLKVQGCESNHSAMRGISSPFFPEMGILLLFKKSCGNVRLVSPRIRRKEPKLAFMSATVSYSNQIRTVNKET